MVGECAAVRGQSSLRLVITGGGDTMVTPRGECRVFTQDFPPVTTLETLELETNVRKDFTMGCRHKDH